MRALVVGGGSIGARHLRNLKELGVHELALVEPSASRRSEIAEPLGATPLATLEEGLRWDPALAVIATPSSMHVEQSLALAQRGCDLFIEKPLSHTIDGLQELDREVSSRGLVTIVGCNMRFHPGPAGVKAALERGDIGRVLFARVHMGSYLPGWRPWQDYRRSYSANAALGGGCILDIIHEIDLTHWYLGPVTEVLCVADRVSSLELDVEDYAVLLCRHQSGARSEIHLDYVQRTYERGCQIVGEAGSLFWDYTQGRVRRYLAAENAWSEELQPAEWEPNRMYVDEMAHFLSCVRERRETLCPVSEAMRVLEVALAAKQSARERRVLQTRSTS